MPDKMVIGFKLVIGCLAMFFVSWSVTTTATEPNQPPELTFKERCNVFTTGQDVVIDGVPSGTRRVYDLTDHLKRSVAQVAFDPASQKSVAFGKLPAGFYHVFRAGQEQARFCIVEEHIQARSAKSVAQMDLGRNGVWPISTTRRAARLCQLAGVRSVRERWAYGWASMEPEKGQFVLGPMMEFLEVEKQYGLQATLVFMGLPGWAGREYGDDLRETFTSAREISRRMKGVVCCWEYWNEEDSWPFGQGPAHRYSAALKAAYLGFRETDSNGASFKVATGGISSIARAKFMDDVLANPIGDYFDVYNSHIYENLDNHAWAYARHSELLAKHGLAGKEKWITEGGAETHLDLTKNKPKWNAECEVPQVDLNTATCDVLPDEAREEVTARLIKSWVYGAQYGWSRFFTFCLAYYNEGVKIWGMLAPGLTATSSYAGLATYNHWLGNLDYAGKMALPKGLEGHRYRGQGRQVAVLWSTGSKQTIELLPNDTLYFMTGEKIAAGPGSVPLDDKPVFMVMHHDAETLEPTHPVTISPQTKPAASRIILDFVRTPRETRWKVNTQRTFILDSLKQEVTGDLYVYNFNAQEWRGDLQAKAPDGWHVTFEQTSVTVPAMGRVVVKTGISADDQYKNDVQRIMIATNHGRASVSVSFIYDNILGIKPLSSLIDDNIQCVPDAPSRAELTRTGDRLGVKMEFGGKTPTVRFRASLPKIKTDGIYFTLSRRPEKGSPAYIDVRVTNRDGSVSRLEPNIFPVFLDGVLRESHVVSYAGLQPPTDGQNAVRAEVSFSAFDPGTVELDLSEWKTWTQK